MDAGEEIARLRRTVIWIAVAVVVAVVGVLAYNSEVDRRCREKAGSHVVTGSIIKQCERDFSRPP